ncbi:DinB family protein [Mucilaginibacter sabulilitoris]|uniref:DinB family protein n=1 Tax=Mucilaginibacter sabulilitoris TaxID=1173583 RepID=A0ABZ0TWH0_9SPHI|nr:DinB family protein [Mucilaginibacter sabulilitoris]WPU96408.1 DinB family protein [Mucilaginibacter sabulilitoris]
MIQYLNKLEEERRLLLERTKELTVDQYNIIPPGFNNNIIWNMGHILVVSESLLYQDSPYQRPVYEFMKYRFEKGSIPDEIVGEDDIFIIRYSLQQTVQFYKMCTGMERSGRQIPSVSNSCLTIISNKRMQFLLFHEDMHYRRIAKLMEIVRK